MAEAQFTPMDEEEVTPLALVVNVAAALIVASEDAAFTEEEGEEAAADDDGDWQTWDEWSADEEDEAEEGVITDEDEAPAPEVNDGEADPVTPPAAPEAEAEVPAPQGNQGGEGGCGCDGEADPPPAAPDTPAVNGVDLSAMQELAEVVNSLGGVKAVAGLLSQLKANAESARQTRIRSVLALSRGALTAADLEGMSNTALGKLEQALKPQSFEGAGRPANARAVDSDWEDYVVPVVK